MLLTGRACLAASSAVAVCLTLSAAQSQQQPPPQKPAVFKSGVTLVHLDVSVLGRDRRPVRGLTRDDFTVLEDGRPQPILAFSAVDVPVPAPPPAAWMRRVARDVQTNDIARTPEGRLFVILLDDAMLPPEPRFVENAKTIARQVIEQITPADRVAVVFSVGSGGAQNFTNDRARLLAAIDTLRIGYANYTLGWDSVPPAAVSAGRGSLPFAPQMDPDTLFKAGSMRTLRTVAETLIAAPERRKILVYVSPGITVDVDSASTPTLTGSRGARGAPSMALKEANATLFKEMPELFRRMRVANVSIYPVDPTGLGGLEDYIMRRVSSLPALRGVTAPPPPGYDYLAPTEPPPPMYLSRHLSTLSLDFVMAAASNTGGRAIVNTNDFTEGIQQIFEENASYYLIGYAAPDNNRPGSLNRIEVKVNRPGVDVRTRSGYEMPADADRRDRPAPSPTMNALSTPVATGDLPLRVVLAPIATADGAAVTIALGLVHPPVTERTTSELDLETRAFTPDGQPRGSSRQTASVVIVPTPSQALAEHELLSTMPLKPGRYEIRLAAHRRWDGLAGSVYADVVVPDFAGDRLSASGVFVESAPSPPTGPRSVLAGLVPVTPTTKRTFSRSDRVTVFVRFYQGGNSALQPVTLAIRAYDTTDARILDGTEVIAADRFDATSRAADYRLLVPTSTLSPGTYLLTIDASLADVTVTRSMQFQVR